MTHDLQHLAVVFREAVAERALNPRMLTPTHAEIVTAGLTAVLAEIEREKKMDKQPAPPPDDAALLEEAAQYYLAAYPFSNTIDYARSLMSSSESWRSSYMGIALRAREIAKEKGSAEVAQLRARLTELEAERAKPAARRIVQMTPQATFTAVLCDDDSILIHNHDGWTELPPLPSREAVP
jgi:hypothetical protein